jgi:saccharopine dehydrogenase (NADP+, L-glutamate forming)
MKSILLLGAGRSANVLIKYLEEECGRAGMQYTVADQSMQLIDQKTARLQAGTGLQVEVSDKEKLNELVASHRLVISLLPPTMHVEVAKICLEHKKHLVTASYISEEMRKLDAEAKSKGLLFLNECGLDPGIDHMSAMEMIDEIRAEGGQIHTFKSWCGGLVAPESDDNPWGYKISWNPWNVVQAGKGISRFREGGKLRLLPYHQLFRHAEPVVIPDQNLQLEGYANRDSLVYDAVYGLENAKTIIRGTLRKQGYCKAWSVLVQLGLTDDTLPVEVNAGTCWPEWLKTFLPGKQDVKMAVRELLPEMDDATMSRLDWMGLFDEQNKIEKGGTLVAAAVLQQLMEKKWLLKQSDKDMVVMLHEFGYTTLKGENMQLTASLLVMGDDNEQTAMAKTVGLPLGIAAMNILNGNILENGVSLPAKQSIYEPLLYELTKHGIVFLKTPSTQ